MTISSFRVACGTLVGLAVVAAGSTAFAQSTDAGAPLLRNIYMATIGTTDVGMVEQAYTSALGLKVRRRGKTAMGMAESWGAPKSAGRPYILLSSERSPEAYLRVVETDAVAGEPARASDGWDAFVIRVDDLAHVKTSLAHSAFKIVAKARPLDAVAPNKSFQVVGPAGETIIFAAAPDTCTNTQAQSAPERVDRPYMLVLGGQHIDALRAFYVDNFKLAAAPKAAGGSSKARALQACGNTIAFDGHSGAMPRPHAPGQLPTGNAMATFTTHSFDDLRVSFITPPGGNYGARRSAAINGPAGEIVELIEDPRR